MDMLTINGGSNESLLVGVNYGDASGSRPQVTETSRRARWNGLVVGVHKSSGDVIQEEIEPISQSPDPLPRGD